MTTRCVLVAISALGLSTAASAGASKERPARLISSPNGLPGLFSGDDYPAEALRSGEEGTSKLDITITPLGRIGKCVVTASSGSALLDNASCTVLTERARYAPARDAKGQPTSVTESRSIRWLLPVELVKNDFIRAIVTLDRGAATACRNEGSVDNVANACDLAQDPVKWMLATDDMPPARDAVFESGVRVGKGEGLEAIGTGPGFQRIYLMASIMTIGPNGKVADCRPAAGITDDATDNSHCAGIIKRKFEPQPAGATAPRLLTAYQLLYLRGATALPRLTNLAGLFGPDDYPADALAQSREGRVAAEVTVEADGRASGCRVRTQSGTPSLDAVTCAKLLRIGKYEPARDPEQRLVRGTLTTRVAWTLPRAPIDDRLTRIVIALPAGSACAIEGSPSGDLDCDQARAVGSLALASPDAKGKRAIVVESGQVIGNGESIERIDEERGRTPWSLSAVTLMVDASGKLVECKPSFDWVEADEAKAQCDLAREEKFAPLAAGVANRQPRALTRYEAIYFRN